MGTDVGQRYGAIRAGMAQQGAPIMLLHIGAQQTVLATGVGTKPAHILTLDIGTSSTAARFFLHVPPTPREIEDAIQQVEDEVARARAMVAGPATLLTTDAAIREIAQVAGYVGAPKRLALAAVEQVFARLASNAAGLPAAAAGTPGNPAFAATLLILREFMHHLSFQAIDILEADDA